MDLILGEAVLIEEEVEVVETNGIVDQREETCLAEEVIPHLEEVDLNIQLLVMILVQNIILEVQKDILVEEEEVNIQIVTKDQGILILEEMNIVHQVIQLVKG